VVWVMQFSMAPPVPSGGQTACRFGYNCRRADCYFAHPEGRAITNGVCAPQSGGMGSPTVMPPGFVMRNQAGPGGMAPPLPLGAPTLGGYGAASVPPPGGRGGGGNVRPCKFGIECTRGDCYFSHRGGGRVGGGGGGGRGGGGRGGAGGRGGGRGGGGGGGAMRAPVPVTDPNQVPCPSPHPRSREEQRAHSLAQSDRVSLSLSPE